MLAGIRAPDAERVNIAVGLISEAERHGDRVLVLADGELLFDGPPADLKAAATASEGQDLEQAFVRFLRERGH
jgi:ABC-type multidrug transport system ATPase subunit